MSDPCLAFYCTEICTDPQTCATCATAQKNVLQKLHLQCYIDFSLESTNREPGPYVLLIMRSIASIFRKNKPDTLAHLTAEIIRPRLIRIHTSRKRIPCPEGQRFLMHSNKIPFGSGLCECLGTCSGCISAFQPNGLQPGV